MKGLLLRWLLPPALLGGFYRVALEESASQRFMSRPLSLASTQHQWKVPWAPPHQGGRADGACCPQSGDTTFFDFWLSNFRLTFKWWRRVALDISCPTEDSASPGHRTAHWAGLSQLSNYGFHKADPHRSGWTLIYADPSLFTPSLVLFLPSRLLLTTLPT